MAFKDVTPAFACNDNQGVLFRLSPHLHNCDCNVTYRQHFVGGKRIKQSAKIWGIQEECLSFKLHGAELFIVPHRAIFLLFAPFSHPLIQVIYVDELCLVFL